jgi:aminopeptidase N
MQLLKIRKLALAVSLLCITSVGFTVSAARRERLIEGWRPLQFNVALTFSERLDALASASTIVRIAVLKDGLRVIDLDFGDLEIDSVMSGGTKVPFSRADGRLLVLPSAALKKGDEIEITIVYHGRPKDGLIFAQDRDGQATVVGDNWPDRVHNWIPCLDHPSAKAPVSFTITAPAADLVVANGAMTGSVASPNRTTTWTYTEPAPVSPYNMIVAVGPFAKGQVSTPFITWYVPQSDAQFATKGFAPAADAVRIFSETVAPFPYPKLGLIVGATRFGGMENAGAIVFPGTLFNNFAASPRARVRYDAPRGVTDVIAHEIAHQWFGDSVTESTWADLWLSEGFATYFTAIFRERTEGKESFRAYMDQQAKTYFAFEQQRRIPIHDTETPILMDLLNPNNYQKGAWVLHMLRSQLGDDKFFTGLRNYYSSHKDGVANSDDLRAALEKSSGHDLREFFTRWVYGAGHPVYRVRWRWVAGRPGKVRLEVEQTQSDEAFLTPLPIELVHGNNKKREIILPTGKYTAVEIPFGAQPETIRVDPDGTVLQESSVTEIKIRKARG